MNECASNADSVAACAKTAVQDYPLTSLLVVFGVGMAVGLVLVETLGDSVEKAFERELSTPEKLGRRISDLLKSNLPESVMRQFVA